LEKEDCEALFNECYKALLDEQTAPQSNQVTPIGHIDVSTAEESNEEFDPAAVANDYQLRYQPIVSLQGNDLQLYDAILYPSDSASDQTGENTKMPVSSVLFDRWSIEQALANLQANKSHDEQTRLLLKLSHHSLIDEGFSSWLTVILEQYEISPQALILEISEQDANGYLTAAKALINALTKLQIEICIGGIDNCHETPQVLQYINAQYLKISSSLSKKLVNQSDDAAELGTLVKSLQENGTRVIIPEVNNASILPSLWQIGVDLIQGDYLQPPSPEMNYEFSDVA
jgi:EAL domain-containing protein (putative c-di-GMP-specific phosphodiesterase class I)